MCCDFKYLERLSIFGSLYGPPRSSPDFSLDHLGIDGLPERPTISRHDDICQLKSEMLFYMHMNDAQGSFTAAYSTLSRV